jgi:TolB-like protein/predicted Ser/Thr protein kinase
MLCPKCLSENADTSKFCNNCGLSLGPEEQPGFSATKTLETPAQAIPKGSLIAGKYRIIEEIGRGGMGIVYKAEDTKLQRTVALKFLPHQWTADAAARERFIHEAQAASALDHPNICTIHEIEETEDGRMYIAMAFYEGESLKEMIKREPLESKEAINVAIQVAQGMTKAHQKGIVHRDIKPANILITNDGVAKIVDFGLAKLAGQVKLTREGTTIGTVAYMSPEQARGEAVDQRTDIWSLGVVLYEMLSGKLPFKGDYEQTLIHSILKTEPEPITKFRKDLPSGLAQIIAKTLAKNPAARYESMDELVEDLNAVAEGFKPLRAKTGLLGGKILGIKKIYAYAGLAIFIILIALALLFFFPKHGKVYDSIAVLPFENLSGDSDQDYFSDEFTDELITRLYAIESLRVTSFRQVKDYKNTKKSYREIGQELKVKAVLDAGMHRVGKRVRITPKLIDAETGRAIWVPSPHERDEEDILALQSEVALDIVRKIQVVLSLDEQKRLASSQKVDPRAYDAYLEAKNIVNAFNKEPTFER